jgi:hypothetical protein
MSTSTISVTISANPGSLTYSPAPLTFNPGDMISWSVNSMDGWEFDQEAGGIAIDTNGGGIYGGWPGAQPSVDAGVYSVTAPPNNLNTMYRWTINLTNPTKGLKIRWDPEMENQPGP